MQDPRRSAPSFLNNAGVLEPYVEHGEQAQRSNGGPISPWQKSFRSEKWGLEEVEKSGTVTRGDLEARIVNDAFRHG